GQGPGPGARRRGRDHRRGDRPPGHLAPARRSGPDVRRLASPEQDAQAPRSPHRAPGRRTGDSGDAAPRPGGADRHGGEVQDPSQPHPALLDRGPAGARERPRAVAGVTLKGEQEELPPVGERLSPRGESFPKPGRAFFEWGKASPEKGKRFPTRERAFPSGEGLALLGKAYPQLV